MIAFLVEHPSAGPILIDTGFHPSVAVEPKQAHGTLRRAAVQGGADGPRATPCPRSCAARGIDPGDVETVVMTHLHSDHASGIAEFPDARFVVSAQEWEAASNGQRDRRLPASASSTTPSTTAARLRRRRRPDSFASFGRSLDLFGDGSVRMVFTPGHTHGHCAVVLRLDGREALICGDAAYTMRTIEESHLPFKMADEHRFRRSLREIQLYIEQTPDAVVIPGHDMAAWRRLDSVYE